MHEKRRKILWLSHLLPYPPKGGVMQRSYNLIKELAKYHDITLLAFNQRNILTPEQVPSAVDHFNQFCESVEVFDIRSESSFFQKYLTIIRGLLPWNTYNTIWLESEHFRDRLKNNLAETQFDFIHVDTISLIPFVKGITNIGMALNHHNIESLMMLRRASNEKNILKKIYFSIEGLKLKKYEENYCKKFQVNITCSSLDSERLLMHAKDITCIDVPNGVDLDYFNRIPCQRELNSLIFAGGLNWYPNYDAMKLFLEDIWPLLSKELPNLTMTIIGISPPTWMQEMAAESTNLRVLGFVDDVRPYLSKAHIYVCPIRDGGGTKLKVLDALAMEVPLIADPISCEGIAVRDGHNVIYAKSPQEYLDGIRRLVDDPDLYSNISINGRRLIETQYSFSSLGARLAATYEDCISRDNA